jgi:hypothetical protein
MHSINKKMEMAKVRCRINPFGALALGDDPRHLPKRGAR